MTIPMKPTCDWDEDPEGDYVHEWETDCGNLMPLDTGISPTDMGMKVCPWCGKPLRVVAQRTEPWIESAECKHLTKVKEALAVGDV